MDGLFRKISKHSIGFHVFKVENDHIETLSKDQLGIFYDENVYIIYAAAVKGTNTDQTTIVRNNLQLPIKIGLNFLSSFTKKTSHAK